MPKLEKQGQLPSWLTQEEHYQPTNDRDGFIARSALSISSALARLRLDGGAETPLSPSAPVKLLLALACLLLVSLARNYLFVLIVLAGVLVRACLLPRAALLRVVTTSLGAALLALVIMLPAILLGQPHSALGIAGKTLTCSGIAMETALSTPPAELTGALRKLGMPNVLIMTLDLTLKSIVRLGEVALEALSALRLRSVGRNQHKDLSMGGIGGVVLLKAAEAAQQTHDAMRCRGFTGSYDMPHSWRPRAIDLVWLCLLAVLLAIFCYLQGLIAP